MKAAGNKIFKKSIISLFLFIIKLERYKDAGKHFGKVIEEIEKDFYGNKLD
jgi:hypothetical protein